MKQVNYTKIYRVVNRVFDTGIKGSGRMAILLSGALLPEPKGKLIAETIYGFKLLIDPENDRAIERSLYLTGTYEKGTLHIIQRFLREGECFVDAGANIGLMSVIAAYAVGREGKVIAFEANPLTKSILDHNVALNKLEQVISLGYALGSQHTFAKIYASEPGNRGTSSLISRTAGQESYNVEVIRLDECEDAEKISMLKVDVEGYELEVLKGFETRLKSPDAPALIVECSDGWVNAQSTKEELYDFIRGINAYKIFKLKKGKRIISPLTEIRSEADLPDHDNMFCFLPHHFNRIATFI